MEPSVIQINRGRLMFLLAGVLFIALTFSQGSWRSVVELPKQISSSRLDVAAERYALSIGKTVADIQSELLARAREAYDRDRAAGMIDCKDSFFWSDKKCALWIPNATFLIAPPVDDMNGYISSLARSLPSLMPLGRDLALALVAAFIGVFAIPFAFRRTWKWLTTGPN